MRQRHAGLPAIKVLVVENQVENAEAVDEADQETFYDEQKPVLAERRRFPEIDEPVLAYEIVEIARTVEKVV